MDISFYSFCIFHSGQLSMGHRFAGMLWNCMYKLSIFNIGRSHFLRTPQGEALWQPIATAGIIFSPKETLGSLLGGSQWPWAGQVSSGEWEPGSD